MPQLILGRDVRSCDAFANVVRYSQVESGARVFGSVEQGFRPGRGVPRRACAGGTRPAAGARCPGE